MTDAVAILLSRARDSLADARLLAEHRRANEVVLTRLALHQALQAISLSEGLDANDELRLDTLLKRVPDDHPQAALVEALRATGAQTIAAVSELVEALAAPRPRPVLVAPKPARRTPEQPGRTEAPDAALPDLSGPTALALSPQGHGRAGPASSFPSAAFWTLMDRWRIDDLQALALIGHEGGLTKKGTRPRFRLQDEEAVRYASLRALDTALETLDLQPHDWLSTPRVEAPFGGGTPLALLQKGGARELLHALNRQGLQAALQGS